VLASGGVRADLAAVWVGSVGFAHFPSVLKCHASCNTGSLTHAPHLGQR
jgi:hypothetical protein